MKKKSEFHQIHSCNKCGVGINKVFNTSAEEGYIVEADTLCEYCNHKDHWAYGHFESSGEPDGIESKCKKYYN